MLMQARSIIQTAATICTLLVSDLIIIDLLIDRPLDGLEQQAPATSISSAPRTLAICNPRSNCVSSNYREPPNRYISPFRIVNEPDVAFQRAVRDLKSNSAGSDITLVEIVPKDYYILYRELHHPH